MSVKIFEGTNADKQFSTFLKVHNPIITGLFKTNLPSTVNRTITIHYED